MQLKHLKKTIIKINIFEKVQYEHTIKKMLSIEIKSVEKYTYKYK